LNGTHHLLACGDDINLRGEIINPIKKNTYAPLDTSKEVDLEGNTENKPKFTSHHQYAGQNHNIKILLKWILKKQSLRMWTKFLWLRIGFSGRLL
jgi:hypothetical protein